jgi:hypothetical protein
VIVLGWPQAGGWVIGTFLGVEPIFCGLSMFVAPRQTVRAIPTATTIGQSLGAATLAVPWTDLSGSYS